MYAVLWWTIYTIIGIWAMDVYPGVDFFLPGLIVCLQKNKTVQAGWLVVAWTLILEGTGAVSFGYAVLWYGLLVCLYVVGCWIFESRNVLFMCLLGAVAGLAHYSLIMTMVRLQDLTPADPEDLLRRSIVQAVIFPVEWFIVDKLYPKRLTDEPAL